MIKWDISEPLFIGSTNVAQVTYTIMLRVIALVHATVMLGMQKQFNAR